MKRHSAPSDDAFDPLRRVRADIDRQIGDAVARGDFDALAGEGRRLPADPDEAAGERWAAAHVMRNANAAPEWIDLRRAVFAERNALARRLLSHRAWLEARHRALEIVPAERLLEHARATEDADRRFGEEMARAVGDVNAKIERHNLLVRARALQLFPLTLERLRELADRNRQA